MSEANAIKAIGKEPQKGSTSLQDRSRVKINTSIPSWNRIGDVTLWSFVKKLFFLLTLLSVTINLSCDKSDEPTSIPISKPNSPPVVTSVRIVPEGPNVGSELAVVTESHDPDGDPVTYHYQWVKNDEEMLAENKNILEIGNFRKGDLIRVKVTPSDGKKEGGTFLSDPVRILNSPPEIQELWIEPKMVYANDPIRVHVKGRDPDGDSIYYTYQWEKNGAVLKEEKAEVLDKGRFKKGDSITVTVTPDDRESQGHSKRSQPIMISNSPPVIISSPPASVKEDDFIYQVKAYDPDDEPIFFALKSGPKGMEIDKDTGLVRWAIRSQDIGTHSIEIEASDKEGARSYQRFTLNVEIQ